MLDVAHRHDWEFARTAAMARALSYLREAKQFGRLESQLGTRDGRISMRVACRGLGMGLTEEVHTVFPENQALAPFKIRMLDWRGHGFCPARADRFVAMALDGNPVAIDVMVQWVEEYIYRGEKMPENLWYFAQQRLRGKVSVKKGRYRLKSQRNLEIAKVVYDLHKVWSHTLGTPVHMRANDEKSPGSDTSPFYACEIVSEALNECGITLGRDGVYKAWKTHEARVELWWRYLTNEWDEIGLVLGGHPLWDHRNPRAWQ